MVKPKESIFFKRTIGAMKDYDKDERDGNTQIGSTVFNNWIESMSFNLSENSDKELARSIGLRLVFAHENNFLEQAWK